MLFLKIVCAFALLALIVTVVGAIYSISSLKDFDDHGYGGKQD